MTEPRRDEPELSRPEGAAWGFDNSYAAALEGFYMPWQPASAPDPRLVRLNVDLARELGLDPARLSSPDGVAELVGNAVPTDATPLAQGYSGHQFGTFSPVLGDGRALLLGELVDVSGRRRDVALKGSGATPFSRGGDGKAALGPVLREYLLGEAMHALGIPTTRALAALTNGERIVRHNTLHDGPQAGAVLVRIAASHLRVGTFQFVASRGTPGQLRQLADYAIARHFPEVDEAEPAGAERYAALLAGVVERQAALIAAWLSVGFIHGVMNTDNVAISGETIDYGPAAFMEGYDERAVYSSIDTSGRYSYGNQPPIAVWNLSRFAESLLPLLAGGPDGNDGPDATDESDRDDTRPDDTRPDGTRPEDGAVEIATAAVEGFGPALTQAWTSRFAAKLGLPDDAVADGSAGGLIGECLAVLQMPVGSPRVDFTLWWRALADGLRDDSDPARDLLLDPTAYDRWRPRWLARLGDRAGQRLAADRMDAVNPLYVARNHLVEDALAAADAGDLAPFERLLTAVTSPYARHEGLDGLDRPAPEGYDASYVTFCGT